MNDIVLQIHYITNENKVLQRGTFPLKGRTHEKVALDFWKQIKRSMPFECELEKVIVDGEDRTEKVKEIEIAPLE